MVISKIQKYDWKKYWAGKYNILTGLYNAKMDIFAMENQWGMGFNNIFFIFRKDVISYYRRKSETKKLGIFFANKVKKNNAVLLEWADILKDRSEKFINFLQTIKIFNKKNLIKIEHELDQFHPYLMAIFIVVEYLPKKTFKKYKKILTESRISSEPIYDLVEKKLIKYLAVQAKNSGKIGNRLKIGTKAYFINKHEKCAFQGKEVDEIEKFLIKKKKSTNKLIIKGRTGYPGKVKGIARIIHNPKNIKLFNKGDILITGMTRPDFLGLIKKAGAIVTDAGGILSHVAIIARELKMPCVVGAEVATHIIEDGDLVEVDAEKGIVKIIKKGK